MIMTLTMLTARLMAYIIKLIIIGLVAAALLHRLQQHQCNNPPTAPASELLLGKDVDGCAEEQYNGSCSGLLNIFNTKIKKIMTSILK
jgi:hypothetical protein